MVGTPSPPPKRPVPKRLRMESLDVGAHQPAKKQQSIINYIQQPAAPTQPSTSRDNIQSFRPPPLCTKRKNKVQKNDWPVTVHDQHHPVEGYQRWIRIDDEDKEDLLQEVADAVKLNGYESNFEFWHKEGEDATTLAICLDCRKAPGPAPTKTGNLTVWPLGNTRHRSAKEMIVVHLVKKHKIARNNSKAEDSKAEVDSPTEDEDEDDDEDDEQKLKRKVSQKFKFFYEKCKSDVKKYRPDASEAKVAQKVRELCAPLFQKEVRAALEKEEAQMDN